MSSEKVSESDVESESSGSESDSDSLGTAEAPLSQKRKQPTPSSERASSPQSAVKRTKVAQAAQPDSSSSDESTTRDQDIQQDSANTTKTPNGLISSRTVPKNYSPPDGFVAIKGLGNSTDTDLDKIFSPANLAGKQIWHITLPSGIPITSLEEVDLEQAKSGTTIITHNDTEFGLRVESSEDAGKDGLRLLVPINGGVGYQAAAVLFNTTLHMQQSAHPATKYSIPKDKTNSTQGAGRPTIPKAKEVRQQPKGLRMRYWPAGFEADGPDISKTDTSEKGRPEALGMTEAAAKRGDTSSSSDSSSDSEEEEL